MEAKFGVFTKQHPLKLFICNFAKKLLGVKQTTQNDFIFGDLGRINYQSRRFVAIIKYWFKINSCDGTKYIKQVYEMMLNDLVQQPQKRNWASCVRDLLSRLGFMNVWDAQGVGDIKNISKYF